MRPFTIVLPIRGTKEEEGFYEQSITSAIALNPDEIIIAVDDPSPEIWLDRIVDIFSDTNCLINYRIIKVSKSIEWGFQLANVIWTCYQQAKYDKIFSFDIDSIVRPTILEGFDHIGTENIALISYTKRTRIKSIQELIRYIFYRIRVKSADYVFSGNYWVYRPYFFDIVKKDEYQKIKNGVDTFLTEKIHTSNRYKMITRKEIGVKALSLQNEDYDWRQFQDGIWHYAHSNTLRQRLIDECTKRTGKKRRALLAKYPLLYILIKANAYQRWNFILGYLWAKKHQDHDFVKLAKSMSFTEWGYQGGHYVKQIKQFKHAGATGF